mgnify:CR=1 FL=1
MTEIKKNSIILQNKGGVSRIILNQPDKHNALSPTMIQELSDTFENQEKMLVAANKLAKEIASKSPIAIYGLKAVMNYSRDHSINDSLDYNALWSGAMLSQKDMTEAMTANFEKREAEFNKLVGVKKFNESDN